MILITGATGQLGTVVIQNLRRKTSANQIAALVRDEGKASSFKEQGVDIRVGNYDDTASLDKAMQGIAKVLLISGTDGDRVVQQHQNVVDAAKKAGVQCIAYTGRTLRDPTGQPVNAGPLPDRRPHQGERDELHPVPQCPLHGHYPQLCRGESL